MTSEAVTSEAATSEAATSEVDINSLLYYTKMVPLHWLTTLGFLYKQAASEARCTWCTSTLWVLRISN